MWDQDGDGLDDRLQEVASSGIVSAFENMDPGGRLRFAVGVVDTTLQYGAYIRFATTPTAQDSLDLTLTGAQVITRFLSVPYVRVRALFPSLLLTTTLPRVERVEAVSLMYPLAWRAGRCMGVRSGSGDPFPTLTDLGNPVGEGGVVALLDTGINDTPIGVYPGHQDLAGKVLGGAFYGTPGPGGYTDWNQSVNPSQASLGLNAHHGTSMAGLVAGGTRFRILGGIAPEARLLDVKVLDDEGIGYGLAEGLEWCIQNRSRSWSPEAAGIDVINLSLSGLDPSDGSDCVSQLVNAAVDLGIVVVAAMGNDGTCGAVSNPAAADGALTVGTVDAGIPGDPDDDVLAPFTVEGPRWDDGDGDVLDEMKPDVVAPGVSVAAAWGSPVSDGFGYRTHSGTSVSAALVSGLVAVLRAENPALTPDGIRTLLRDTAVHRSTGGKTCSALDPFGADARYHTGWGFGEVDAVGAWEEETGGGRTQFVALEAVWNPAASAVDVRWTTQKETGLSGFRVERAPDAGGVPGEFVTVIPFVAPVGYSDLQAGNRTGYQVSDPAPAGEGWWYRISTVGGAVHHESLPFPVRTEAEGGRALVSVTHNTPESDLALFLGVGDPGVPAWLDSISVLGDLDSVGTVSLVAGTSQVPIFLSRPLFSGASPFLPPGSAGPWWFRVDEGGDPARSGLLNGFTVTAQGMDHSTETPTPVSTQEGLSSMLWISGGATTGIREPTRFPLLRVFPNPVRGSAAIELDLDRPETLRLSVLDVRGGLVRDLARGKMNGKVVLSWNGTDGWGGQVPAGRYFLVLQRPEGRTAVPILFLSR
jgi:hypothetical protein